MKSARASRLRCRRRSRARRSPWPRHPSRVRRSSTSWRPCGRASKRNRRNAPSPQSAPNQLKRLPKKPPRNNVQQFGVREVEKLLRLPRRTIHGLIRAGFVSPSRGPRQASLFSFQDLIVLRTAQALAAANIPAKRITRSLRELRRHLPDAMPLSGLSICAVADRVVVKEGTSRWQAESGQYLLVFEGDPAAGALK